MTREDLEQRIHDMVNKKGMTSDEIIRELLVEEGTNAEEIRQAIADMVRKGEIIKKPDYDKKKFIFYLKET
ncbi:hypothetical protein [Sulfuracidifex tepidarius]|uniref:Uncharacterized protein n=1 Tax=Sulfuracidifex tepidarius TaxID=1294262 RepID=A0A510E4T1_9CREN|nr:hypothetical protein [Sulfuracidifex tepidarius]BBG24323.1 hypothetical protein IC006_1633 [Sulfuracidifex tepidarius]BBG27080.1 hypothetical protein IC007_1610 [Sulfuracidifex tepidarius]